jgi:hypothetical protein
MHASARHPDTGSARAERDSIRVDKVVLHCQHVAFSHPARGGPREQDRVGDSTACTRLKRCKSWYGRGWEPLAIPPPGAPKVAIAKRDDGQPNY